MSEARFRFLSQEDVVAAGSGLDVAATIDVVEGGFTCTPKATRLLPSKSAAVVRRARERGDGRRVMAMPARARRGAVWDIAAERTEAFRERSDGVVPVPRAEAACRGADVIVAGTMAREPYAPRPSGSGRGACSARGTPIGT